MAYESSGSQFRNVGKKYTKRNRNEKKASEDEMIKFNQHLLDIIVGMIFEFLFVWTQNDAIHLARVAVTILRCK